MSNDSVLVCHCEDPAERGTKQSHTLCGSSWYCTKCRSLSHSSLRIVLLCARSSLSRWSEGIASCSHKTGALAMTGVRYGDPAERIVLLKRKLYTAAKATPWVNGIASPASRDRNVRKWVRPGHGWQLWCYHRGHPGKTKNSSRQITNYATFIKYTCNSQIYYIHFIPSIKYGRNHEKNDINFHPDSTDFDSSLFSAGGILWSALSYIWWSDYDHLSCWRKLAI